ncbi:large ribosomal subunit protein uL10m isoform X2 [Channa argus]
MHIHKQKLMAVTKYIPPPKAAPPGAYITATNRVQEENSLVILIKKDLEKLFQNCRMLAVVQNNASNAEDMRLLKHRLYKHGIYVRFFPNKVVQSFLSDSIYCNMAPLFIGPTAVVVSKEPKVKEMLMTLKSSPQMTLLGACIDNTLLSVQGVVHYSKLPSVAVVQGEFVSGLVMLTSNTASMLQRNPTHLSALLQQYIKQQSPESVVEKAT